MPIDPNDPFALDDPGNDDIPNRTSHERQLNRPKAEDEFAHSSRAYRPSARDRKVVLSILMIPGITIEEAARSQGISTKTFRRNFPREMREAVKVRAGHVAGDDFVPMEYHRHQVQSYIAARVSVPNICAIMFGGTMTESRFVELFSSEIALGLDAVRGDAVNTHVEIMRTGAHDRDRLAAAKWLASQKQIGAMRAQTRHDVETREIESGATNEEISSVEEQMIDELVAAGIDAALARAHVKALGTIGEGKTRDKSN